MYLLTSRDYCKKKLVISTDLTNPESAPDEERTKQKSGGLLE